MYDLSSPPSWAGDGESLTTDPVHDSLAEWLRQTARNPCPYRFATSDIAEQASPSDDIVGQLGQMMLRNKADVETLRKMTEVLGWADAGARLAPSRMVGLRRGDFGEALASEVLEAFEGYLVPIRKLRYQTDPEQAMHGTDIVAFEMEAGHLADLHFVECKLRTTAAIAVGVTAHTQLASDRDDGYGDTLGFLGERLAERDLAMFAEFLAYLADRQRPDRGSYGIFLVFDAKVWDDDVLARVDEIAVLLDPLHIRATQIVDLREVVELAYAQIGASMVDDER